MPTSGTSEARSFWVLPLLFFFSGIAALLYQVVWTKKLALVFGVTTHAVSTTLSIFMLGLALGSWYFGSRVDSSSKPLRIYYLLEFGIAFSAAISLLLLESMNALLGVLRLDGASSLGFTLFRFAGSFVVLIVPTFLMGGTLPVLAKVFISSMRAAGFKLGLLFAVNTFGGVVGCIGAGFFMIPALGMRGTLLAGVLINLLVALLAYKLASEEAPQAEAAFEPAAAPISAPETTVLLPDPALRRAMLIGFFMAGFLGLAAEVVWTRMLLLNVDPTAQAFAGMLGVYLFGLATGSAVGGKFADRFSPAAGYGTLQVLIAIAMVATMALWSSTDSVQLAVSILKKLPASFQNNTFFKLCVYLLQSSILVLIPTFLMGCAFPFVGRFFASEISSLGNRLGGAYMVNTMGAMSGPLIFGFFLLPPLGIQATLLLCAAGAAASGSLILFTIKEQRRVWAAGAAMIALLFAGSALLLPEKVIAATYTRKFGKVLSYEEDVSGSVLVLQINTPTQNFRKLVVGVTSMISSNYQCRRYTRLIGHIPMLLHPAPKKALVICLGSGMTLASVACHDDAERIECADISSGVVNAARQYFSEANSNVLDNPRVKLVLNDGRTHLLASSQNYDVIALEPPPPNAASASNLYSVEFYKLCRERLSSEGMVIQWVPYHGATFPQIRAMVASMQDVFPATTVWGLYDNQEYAIIGHMDDRAIPYERIVERFEKTPAIRADLTPVGIKHADDVLACFVMSGKKVAAFTDQAERITDDNPGLGYDMSAFGQLDGGSIKFIREVQIAGMVTESFGEDAAGWLSFKDDNARVEFKKRFAPKKSALEMQNRAVNILVLGKGSPKFPGLARGFVPPILSEPDNAYYQFCHFCGLYGDALDLSKQYFAQAGSAEDAKHIDLMALKLKAFSDAQAAKKKPVNPVVKPEAK